MARICRVLPYLGLKQQLRRPVKFLQQRMEEGRGAFRRYIISKVVWTGVFETNLNTSFLESKVLLNSIDKLNKSIGG